ncbi:MAG: ABC transporter permease [Enterocloster asparagiformis]|nr:ABC transporter permease [Enterocloster asparagiformis]
MKLKDLFRVCLQNLNRHKARTMLTVLGVIVGCCSVVIMISIGIGMKDSQEKALAQMGDLTIITVYSAGKSAKAAKLDERAVQKFREMSAVSAVMPKLTADNVPITLYAGKNRRYKAEYVSIVGVDMKAAREMGYQLEQGDWDQAKKGKVFTGSSFAYFFADTKRPEGRNMMDIYGAEGMDSQPSRAFFNPLKTPLFLELTGGKDEERKVTVQLEAAGKLKEDYGKGEETVGGMLMDLGELRALLDQQARLSGKRNTGKGRYSNVLVKVNDIGRVAETERLIKQMGFRTSSMESIRRPMEQEARQKQMMLGGLGAISLFVAALGITNTMIMSISERTREIGVMKSLGCFVRDIRRLFLLEAGCIGLLGGAAGVAVSWGISLVMNLAAGQAQPAMADYGMPVDASARLSIIPWWLALFAVVFSVLIGVGAGYYPANKAVGIPALEAIKHD